MIEAPKSPASAPVTQKMRAELQDRLMDNMQAQKWTADNLNPLGQVQSKPTVEKMIDEGLVKGIKGWDALPREKQVEVVQDVLGKTYNFMDQGKTSGAAREIIRKNREKGIPTASADDTSPTGYRRPDGKFAKAGSLDDAINRAIG